MLAGPQGRPAARLVLDLFLLERQGQVQEALGHALAEMAGAPLAGLLPELAVIVEDSYRYPRSRWPVAQAVGRIGTPEALALARKYVDDQSLGWCALEGYTRGGGRLTDDEISHLETEYLGDRASMRLLARHRRRNGS